MKFAIHNYDNFAEFSKAINSVFNNTEFLQHIPSDCKKYTLKIFNNKGDLRVFIKDRFIKEKKPFLTLNGSLYNFNSDEIVVMFISDLVSDEGDEVCLGGVFSC